MYSGRLTAHNLFRLRVVEDDFDLNKIQCDIPHRSQRAALLREACLIIFDEITMTHRNNLRAIDEVLRKVRNEPNEPFGGVVFLCAGDFRQILPIVKNGTRADTVDATIKNSPLWNEFKLHELTTPVRQQHDVEFSLFIDSIANGTCPSTPEVKVTMHLIRAVTNEDEWINFIYPNLHQGEASTTNQALLSVLNHDVDTINSKIATSLPNQFTSLYSHDRLNESSEISEFFKNNMTEEFFNNVNFPNVPPHELRLKVGMECFLVRNLSPDEGLLNNTQVTVDGITRYLLQVRVKDKKKVFYLPRISFAMNLQRKGIKLTRKQFPLRAGYVKTINRAQGSTLQKAGIDLRKDCFAHGQLAVALSRVRNRNDILILTTPGKQDENKNAVTTNVVYHEVLL